MVGVGNRVKTSHVWEYFEKKTDGGSCNICKKIVKGKGGNTSNLEKHLRLKHNIILKSCTMFNSLKVKTHTAEISSDASTSSADEEPAPVSTSDACMKAVSEGPPLPQLPQLQPEPKLEPSVPLSPPQHLEGRKRVSQATLPEYVKPKKSKITEHQKSEIGRAITRYIVKEMQPFSTIASEPFRRVLSSLNPEYIPPNKETLSSIYIPAWYEIEVENLKQDLAQVLGVGITADHWTSLNGDHYLTVTAQYVKDWSLYSKVLATKAVYESQTGEAIEGEIRDILVKFGILGKVVGITVDNAANMAAGARLLDIMRVPCFAHSMNISASKLYNETSFTRWLARIRSVVVWFKRVHMAGVVLKEKLANLELPNHTVILDVKTRWNSMYLMVERFAEVYPGLSAACRDPRLKSRVDKDKIERISDADLKKSEEFVETMKILYTSTLAISTDKLPTIGQVLPTWSKLEKCFSIQDEDSEFTKTVKTTVWRDMQKRYQDPEVVHFLEEASALDPRFKTKVMNEVWGRLESKVADLIQPSTAPTQEVKIKVESDIHDTTPDRCDSLTLSPEPKVSDEDIEIVQPTLKRKRSAIEELFADDDDEITVTKIEAPPSPQVQAHLQIEQYRSMPKMKILDNTLDFYKTHCNRFPMVAALACRYFCVSGSSVPSERVFSLAGNTISQERVRIDPEKADMLIFLHKNAA